MQPHITLGGNRTGLKTAPTAEEKYLERIRISQPAAVEMEASVSSSH